MIICRLLRPLFVVTCAALIADSVAQLIPQLQARVVTSSSTVQDAGGTTLDERAESAPDFGTFNMSVSSSATRGSITTHGSAGQFSWLGPTVRADGMASANGPTALTLPEFSRTVSGSDFSFSFTTAFDTPFALRGTLNDLTGWTNDFSIIKLTEGSIIFEKDTIAGGATPFDYAGTLRADSPTGYGLRCSATCEVNSQQIPSGPPAVWASYSLELDVGVVLPAGHFVPTGTPFGGDLQSLVSGDGDSLTILPSDDGPEATLQVTGRTSLALPTQIRFAMSGRVGHSDVVRIVQLKNFASGFWDTISVAIASQVFEQIEIPVTANAWRYVGPSGQVESQILWQGVNEFSDVDGYGHLTDHVRWYFD